MWNSVNFCAPHSPISPLTSDACFSPLSLIFFLCLCENDGISLGSRFVLLFFLHTVFQYHWYPSDSHISLSLTLTFLLTSGPIYQSRFGTAPFRCPIGTFASTYPNINPINILQNSCFFSWGSPPSQAQHFNVILNSSFPLRSHLNPNNFLWNVQHTASINAWIHDLRQNYRTSQLSCLEEGRSIPAPGSFALWGLVKDGFHLLTQSQWLRSGSSYQLFAEKERDAGFAADSPINEILHMLKLTVENHDALQLLLQLPLPFISNALVTKREDRVPDPVLGLQATCLGSLVVCVYQCKHRRNQMKLHWEEDMGCWGMEGGRETG